jgi:hypothetical protein
VVYCKGSNSKPAFGDSEKYPSVPPMGRPLGSGSYEGPCSFKENEDVWTKDEEKLGKQSIRFNNTLKQFKGFTALTDLKMNILSELVFRQEKNATGKFIG